ncbi:MAG: peptidase and D,D-carboxypeptidase VanY/endolysin [Candidatus Solibacter sp.]|jgi:D-alanyl-D-alanine dipeptidase|nr:peptidase and D,D-carboxypeptidase VanY/endolysin [Candidatus Solibacter sp.]
MFEAKIPQESIRLTFFRSGRVFACLALGSCIAVAQSTPPSTQQDNGHWLQSLLKFQIPKFSTFIPAQPLTSSTCSVAPLSSIGDPGAAIFEASSGTMAVVDTTGLTQATAGALARLEQLVASLGGRLELKSAYRPVAYQEHLQEVWDKMRALRRNRQSGCAAVRADVAAEFSRHHLLVTQRPVTDSDHTRGVGIDAALVLPRGARINRRRITLDRLAQMVGFKRPDVRHDPVHFRMLATSLSTSSTANRATTE